MSRNEWIGVGVNFVLAAIGYLISGPIVAVLVLIVGVAIIGFHWLRRTGEGDSALNLSGAVPQVVKSIADACPLDVVLTPSSGPSTELVLAVTNNTDMRHLYAKCALLALRNSPNELSRRVFDLKWEHTSDKCISIGKGDSSNLLIATLEDDQNHALATMRIWGLSEGSAKQYAWSRWNLDPQERVPEYDLAVTLLSDGAEPLSRQFTVRPKTWHGPLEMVGIVPAQSREDQPPQQRSAAVMQLARISVFEDYQTLEVGKKLAFRIFFTNMGPLLITDSRIVIGTAIGRTASQHEIVPRLQHYAHDAAWSLGEQAKLKPKGPPVGIGHGVWKDIVTSPLEEYQVEGLMNGTVRIYFYAWAGWVGSDGLKAEMEVCLYLPKPGEALSFEDMNNWGVCPIYPSDRLLWQ